MQFIGGLLYWWLRRPLLPVVASGLLTGSVAGTLVYQVIPFAGSAVAIAVVAGVATCCLYCALMDKAIGREQLLSE
ncbi:hypothetical protein ACK8QS_22850 (plasmid) [Ectopseudomonas mendocina]